VNKTDDVKVKMSKPLYIFLSFDLGQRRVRLKPLKRDRVGDDGSTLAGLQQTLHVNATLKLGQMLAK